MKPKATPVAAVCYRRDSAAKLDGGHRPPLQKLNRREFLRVTALSGGGFMLSLALPSQSWAQAAQALDDTAKIFIPSPFIKITSEGVTTLLAPNPETGQGVRTSLPMMLAEELDVDMSAIMVEQASLRVDVGGQLAAGSGSTPGNFMRLRLAGATARAMLIEAAAQTWNVSASELRTAQDRIIHEATGRFLAYGELATKAATLPAAIRWSSASSCSARIGWCRATPTPSASLPTPDA